MTGEKLYQIWWEVHPALRSAWDNIPDSDKKAWDRLAQKVAEVGEGIWGSRFVTVCHLCGQPLEPNEQCNSGAHVGPHGGRQGRSARSNDVVPELRRALTNALAARAPANDNRVGKSRADHGETAKSAALEVMPRTGTQRRRVLDMIRRFAEHGCTRDDIAEDLDLSPNTVRPRVKELIDGGWVAVHPVAVGRSASNRRAELLILTEYANALAGSTP